MMRLDTLRHPARRLGIFVAAVAVASVPAPGEPNVQQRERVLADLPGTILGDLQTSPGNRHVFAAVRLTQTAPDPGAWAVYRDGALVGRYDGELPKRRLGEFLRPGLEIAFSSDGGHYAFIGTRGGHAFVVVDGIEGPHYDAVTGLQIGRDGRTVAYTVGRSPWQRLVTNGRVGLRYFSVGARVVSPDGRHLVHQVSTGTVSRLFLDGNVVTDSIAERDPVHGYLQISWVQFSPDSRHLAFVATSNKGARAVLDGATVGVYPEAGWPTFSPDSRRLAFIVSRRAQPISIVIDGAEHTLRSGDGLAEQGAYIHGGRFLWSADSRHYVYVVTRGSAFAIVHDGVESPPYPRIGTFSVRFLDDGRLAYSAFDGSAWTTFIGSERIPGMRLRAITPDGRHRAYTVGDSDREWSVDRSRYQAPRPVPFAWFSGPRGRALLATNGLPDAPFLMIGRSIQYHHRGRVSFTPDERHHAIVDSASVYLDGTVLLGEARSVQFSFDGNDVFHAFLLRGNRLVRVDGRFLRVPRHQLVTARYRRCPIA